MSIRVPACIGFIDSSFVSLINDTEMYVYSLRIKAVRYSVADLRSHCDFPYPYSAGILASILTKMRQGTACRAVKLAAHAGVQ